MGLLNLELIPERRQIAHDNQQSSQDIHPREIDVVQHFLNNVCPPDLLQKLQLVQYSERMMTNKNSRIYQEDKDTAHARIIADILRVLAREVDARLTVLQGYATRQLVQHLSKVDLALVDRDLKSQIGPDLVKLFNDKTCIDNLFRIASPAPGVPDWMWEDRSADQIKRWLKDSAVVSDIDEESQSWIDELMENPFPALLRPSAARMAVHCLREPSPPDLALATFKFILHFVCKTTNAPTNLDSPSLAEIQQAEQWSQMVVAVPTPDALWQVQMALVFQGLGNLSFAEDRCRRALDLEPSNWRALHILAQSVADNHAAIEILDSLIDRLEKDAAWIKVHQKSLAKMAWNLGNRHWQAEQFNNASEAYSKCIENDPTDSMTFLEILRGYHKRDQWNDIISLVKKLQSFGETHLAAVTVRLAESDDFHKIIHQVAMNRNELKILDVVYTDGIQYASQNQDYNAMIYLSYFQAKILSSLPNPPVDAVMEILEAALKIGLHLTTNPPHLLYMIGTLLGKIYYNKALLQTSSGHHESAIKFLEKISEIRCEQVPDEYLVFPPRMYLVRYYHLQGDDRMARQVARNTLQLALEILSDDDLSNDIWAFLKIGKITVAFLDKKNTATAFAMEALAGTALRKSQKPPEERPRENPDKAGREWECPRKCDSYGYRGENPGGLWACADCIEVNLSTDCRDKLLKGEFMKNVCDPSHNGFYIDEWDTERLKKVPLGYVPWGDQNITMEDWKNVLREKYLPNS